MQRGVRGGEGGGSRGEEVYERAEGGWTHGHPTRTLTGRQTTGPCLGHRKATRLTGTSVSLSRGERRGEERSGVERRRLTAP